MHADTSAWTGEGSFTPVLLDALKGIESIAWLKAEDAPSSRAESGYAFISTEVYVRFETRPRTEIVRRFGIPWRKTVLADRMTLAQLGDALGAIEGVGTPDYADNGMLQYLKTERIVPPYQTHGIKVVEMVRIYQASGRPQPGRSG